MENNKAWYLSKTIWGSVSVLAAGVLSLFGIDFDAAMQEQAIQLIISAITTAGGAVALVGRVVANSKITK